MKYGVSGMDSAAAARYQHTYTPRRERRVHITSINNTPDTIRKIPQREGERERLCSCLSLLLILYLGPVKRNFSLSRDN